MQPKGIFCISLDFELHWGVFDKKHLPEYGSYFDKTRALIPEMLALFEANEVHVTWATVAALACAKGQELRDHLKTIQANYLNEALRAVRVGVGENEDMDPHHFAHSLIKEIKQVPGQEIGTHTFSHFYTLEPGANQVAFSRDLALSSQYLDQPRSLVFPRNQYNEESLKVAKLAGVEVARSNPKQWFWKTEAQSSEGLWKKVVRTLDHYFALGSKTSYRYEATCKKDEQPLLMPASRFLRPPSVLDKLLPGFKLRRIKNEMTRAAKNGEIYHLWWHPHNFAVNSRRSFDELKAILEHFKSLNAQYDFKSLNMGELADL